MQSSTLVILRTLVMIVALAAIPLAALYGTASWPRVAEAVQTWIEGPETAEPGQAVTASPIAATSLPAEPQRLAPSPLPATMPPLLAGAPSMQAPPATQVLPETAQSTSVPNQGGSGMPTPPFWPAEASMPRGPIQPVQNVQAVGAPPNTASQAVYAAEAVIATTPAAGSDPRQTAIQQRLQAIGALHYRLETAGPAGKLFRFQCKMGLPGNPNYVSYFEATSSEAAVAMQQVLEQVEAWAAGSERR